MNTQFQLNKLPNQSAPVIRHTVSTAANDASGVEASFLPWDLIASKGLAALKGAVSGIMNA